MKYEIEFKRKNAFFMQAGKLNNYCVTPAAWICEEELEVYFEVAGFDNISIEINDMPTETGLPVKFRRYDNNGCSGDLYLLNESTDEWEKTSLTASTDYLIDRLFRMMDRPKTVKFWITVYTL